MYMQVKVPIVNINDSEVRHAIAGTRFKNWVKNIYELN